MIKRALVILLILLSINNVSATHRIYASDGLGTYYVSGSVGNDIYIYDDISGTLYFTMIISAEGTSYGVRFRQNRPTPSAVTGYYVVGCGHSYTYETAYPGYTSFIQFTDMPNHWYTDDYHATITLSNTTIGIYALSGQTGCVGEVTLYTKNTTGHYHFTASNTTGDMYSFDILENNEYKVVFDDTHEYEFTCDGDEVYNYDACKYIDLHFIDNCDNHIYGLKGHISINNSVFQPFTASEGVLQVLGTDINNGDSIEIKTYTWEGGWYYYTTYNDEDDLWFLDHTIYWNMNIYVKDNESEDISDADVDYQQDCIIDDSGYPKRHSKTNNAGKCSFTQCENDNGVLNVDKEGYDSLTNFNIWGGNFDAFNSDYGVTVTLYPAGTDDSTGDILNETINDTEAEDEPTDIPASDYDDFTYHIYLYFKNTDGDRITQINDTDDYVRCYYHVKHPDNVLMTLKFQKTLFGYYWEDVYEYPYSIDNNSYGYMHLLNDNFSDYNYQYRAYIYDNTYPNYNKYAYLDVVNQTYEHETHYENLTAHCWFANTEINDSIDYREEITGTVYANSSNSSLLNVNIELYDQSSLIEYKNLTWADFSPYYKWELGYNYTKNHNYSLVLKGYDDTILDVDEVWAYDLIGNKLTIKVINAFGHSLSNSYIYLEDYGSINTGYINYGTFEGLSNGLFRYKASKSGYRSTAWESVNITDENTIVSYILYAETGTGSIQEVKLTDDEVKNIYYPLIYLLLIIILIGGLMNVFK